MPSFAGELDVGLLVVAQVEHGAGAHPEPVEDDLEQAAALVRPVVGGGEDAVQPQPSRAAAGRTAAAGAPPRSRCRTPPRSACPRLGGREQQIGHVEVGDDQLALHLDLDSTARARSNSPLRTPNTQAAAARRSRRRPISVSLWAAARRSRPVSSAWKRSRPKARGDRWSASIRCSRSRCPITGKASTGSGTWRHTSVSKTSVERGYVRGADGVPDVPQAEVARHVLGLDVDLDGAH